jgi:hypothetical protein
MYGTMTHEEKRLILCALRYAANAEIKLAEEAAAGGNDRRAKAHYENEVRFRKVAEEVEKVMAAG